MVEVVEVNGARMQGHAGRQAMVINRGVRREDQNWVATSPGHEPKAL